MTSVDPKDPLRRPPRGPRTQIRTYVLEVKRLNRNAELITVLVKAQNGKLCPDDRSEASMKGLLRNRELFWAQY